jgi:glyoxylase-like metal-dependent hydrolase (beta-lactamase superfamily II)
MRSWWLPSPTLRMPEPHPGTELSGTAGALPEAISLHPAACAGDADLVRAHIPLGGFELILCSDGPFLLDGGAMFGVVPKTLWSQRTPADAENRILLGLNSVVVRTREAVAVIETGLGNKLSPKMREIHGASARLLASYEAAGMDRRSVTHVVNTHLHFDHCGWNTVLHDDGSVVPAFANARYFCAAGELAHGRRQLERDRVSYLGPNYDPVIAAGQMTVLDLEGRDGFVPGDARLSAEWNGAALPPVPVQTSAELTPGVWVERFPGHTAHMQVVHIESGGEHACFAGDLFPTHHHLQPTWVMGYDLDPLRCIEERTRFLARAIAEDWLVLFPHDHGLPAARLRWDEKGRPAVRV